MTIEQLQQMTADDMIDGAPDYYREHKLTKNDIIQIASDYMSRTSEILEEQHGLNK